MRIEEEENWLLYKLPLQSPVAAADTYFENGF